MLGERTALCFAGVESCDILINGKKIGGNAQRRLKKVIFQHGSIPLVQMADKGDDYLLHPDSTITARTTSLEELGAPLERERLVNLLAAAFEESLGVSLKTGRLRLEERECAGQYMQKTE